jgi:uncharacterized protein (TIGR03083 family)
MNYADAYERSRQRVLALVDDDVAGMKVPTCPGWTVKDVVAHLAGFLAVYRSGADGFSSPGWGDRVVEERRDRSLQDCIQEWNSLLVDTADLFESRLAAVAVSDVLAHEQDIRTALDRPGARDDEGVAAAVEMGLSFLDGKARAGGLPALRIVADGIDRQLGEGEPVATLRSSMFELFRALHGRRTVAQVRAMAWDGDPGPWIPALFLFGPAEETVDS